LARAPGVAGPVEACLWAKPALLVRQGRSHRHHQITSQPQLGANTPRRPRPQPQPRRRHSQHLAELVMMAGCPSALLGCSHDACMHVSSSTALLSYLCDPRRFGAGFPGLRPAVKQQSAGCHHLLHYVKRRDSRAAALNLPPRHLSRIGSALLVSSTDILALSITLLILTGS